MKKRVIKVLLIALMIVSFFYIRNVQGVKNVESAQAWLSTMESSKHLVTAYLLLTITAGVLCLPISWFKACGALYFGFTYGFLYGYTIALISSTVSFGIGRFLGKDWVNHHYEKRFKSKLKPNQRHWVETKGQINFFHIFILRNLYFVPFFMTNYLLSVSRVKFRTYFWATALGMLPGTGVFTYFVSHALDFWKDPTQLLIPFALALTYYALLYYAVKRKRLLT